jgi:hypothetical protein
MHQYDQPIPASVEVHELHPAPAADLANFLVDVNEVPTLFAYS